MPIANEEMHPKQNIHLYSFLTLILNFGQFAFPQVLFLKSVSGNLSEPRLFVIKVPRKVKRPHSKGKVDLLGKIDRLSKSQLKLVH